MVAINLNLLPWREYQRARRRKMRGWILTGILGLIFVSAGCYFFHASHAVLTPGVSAEDSLLTALQKIQYAGFLHQSDRIWAVLRLPDGKIQTVHSGSQIIKFAHIVSISETQIVIAYPPKAAPPRSFSKIKIFLSHS
jgi:hypothetical protein